MMNKIFDNLKESDLSQFMGQSLELDLTGIEDLVPEKASNSEQEVSRLRRLASLLEQYDSATKEAGTDRWFVPGTPFSIDNCPKHRAFFAAGKDYNERMFMAGNRCGKSVAGAYETACHLTGIYPDWWVGRTFDRPVHGWVAGSTARATRDTAQKELIGRIGAWGTGMIPKEYLGKFWALAGVPQGIDVIQVKHVPTGGWSTVGFKNYEQPLQAFYGTDLDFIWPDEECPIEHYNEMLIRTMTTNGIIYNTFTPLMGLTPMVVRYSEKADYLAGAQKLIGIEAPKNEEEDARLVDSKHHKAIIQAGWDDAPWLSEEKKEQMASDTEPHLIEARRSGKPSMGSGNVYPVSIESIICEPFKIPDYYKRLFALDVGWNRTACLWAAIDPQTDRIFIYDEYYAAEQVPAVHAAAIRSRGNWIPGVIDPAAHGRSQLDGTQMMMQYKEQGLSLHPAANAVEAGIQAVWERMLTGNFKIFPTLHNFAKEFVVYRRDLKGRIVKENDHLMDCARYIQNNLIRAKSIDQIRSIPRYSGTKVYNI